MTGLFRVLLLAGLCARISSAQQIAFTFDDLPSHSSLPPGTTRQQVAGDILAALKKSHLPPVYGFVNAVRMEEQPDTVHVLEAWRKAGQPLGNHSWSHMNLDQHTVAEFEADVLRDEAALKQQMGAEDWHWFRFPYLAEGADAGKRVAVRAFLGEHGYKVAAVTMSFGDYAWNDPYARCSAQGNADEIARLETSYLQAAKAAAGDSRAKAKALGGRDIPYVLLMHLGAFDARMLPRLLTLYRELGFTFATLAEAEKDPFYKPDVDLASTAPDTLESALAQRGIAVPRSAGLPSDLDTVCRAATSSAR